MGNKYVDVSATNNGDGTSSAQAGSPGGVGAWNSLVEAFKGTAGYAPAAGDVVYVRTKASGSNLGETPGASFTCSSTPTATAHIFWVFDNGTVWAGDSGVFTLTMQNTRAVTCAAFHDWLGSAGNFKIFLNTAGFGSTVINLSSNYWKEVRVSTPVGGNNNWQAQIVYGGQTAVLENCFFDVFTAPAGVTYAFFNLTGSGTKLKLINPTIDYNGNTQSGATLFAAAAFNGFTAAEVIGGKVVNAQITQNLAARTTTSSSNYCLQLFMDGFDPGNLILPPASRAITGIDSDIICLSNIPGTVFGASYITNMGQATWRSGQNYPYLNSILPDTNNTPWSWQVYNNTASLAYPMVLPVMGKLYTATAAIKTVTAELLINNNLGTPTNLDWWIEVQYIDDSTGAAKAVSTKALTGSLSSSSAAWSTTVYGGLNYNKYKIAVATPTSIKQNTEVRVVIYSTKTPSLATDFYFVEPDFTLT